MKKIVFVILILSLVTIPIFSGCSQVSQLNKLQSPWKDYEKFSYSISCEDEDIGTMDMLFSRVVNTNVEINGVEYNFNGSTCVVELEIANGDNKGDSIYSEVAFRSDFSPIASYKSTYLKGITTTSDIRYNTGKGTGTLVVNDKTSTFKHNNTAYDNEMLYLLVRASDLTDKKYSMSFSSFNNLEGKVNKISITKGGTTKITTPLGAIDCDNYTISAAAKYGEGISFVLSIAKSPISVDNKDAVKAIVQIKEDKYTYLLSSVVIK